MLDIEAMESTKQEKIILKQNNIQNIGYGEDEHCQKASECIKKQLNCFDCDVHFLVGGTQTNLVTISHCLKPYQAVIAPSGL